MEETKSGFQKPSRRVSQEMLAEKERQQEMGKEEGERHSRGWEQQMQRHRDLTGQGMLRRPQHKLDITTVQQFLVLFSFLSTCKIILLISFVRMWSHSGLCMIKK